MLPTGIRVCSCLADCDGVMEADASLQLLQPAATATAVPVKSVVAAGAGSKPKQTLEEMAAWLDAQLAAAPGNCKSLVSHCILVNSQSRATPKDMCRHLLQSNAVLAHVFFGKLWFLQFFWNVICILHDSRLQFDVLMLCIIQIAAVACVRHLSISTGQSP